MRYERDERDELHRQAHHERAIYIAGLITDGYTWIAQAAGKAGQLVSKAWRSSSANGTNSSALS